MSEIKILGESVNKLQLSKDFISDKANKICNAVNNEGTLTAAEAFAAMDSLEKVAKSVKTSLGRDINDGDTAFGVPITVRSGKDVPDYAKDPEIIRLTELIANRKALLLAASKNKDTADASTGEVITCPMKPGNITKTVNYK